MKRILFSITVIVLLLFPKVSLGGDVDYLKAANENIYKAYGSLDAETIASKIYPGGILFAYDSAFPNAASMENTKVERTKDLKMFFNQLDLFSIVPYNQQYRVVGNTGLMWGYATFQIKRKGAPLITRYARVTSTWVKSDGKWFVISSHVSAIPSGE